MRHLAAWRCQAPNLLIVDDLRIKPLPKRSGESLRGIIVGRHVVGRTQMSCPPVANPLEAWGKLVGDVPSATATLDRLLQNVEVEQITGQCYWLCGPQRQEPEPGSVDKKGQDGPRDESK